MNFCQINVSEYFVIANDARHDRNKKKRVSEGERERQRKRGRKRSEGNGTKLDPGARATNARLYKIFARERLFRGFLRAANSRVRAHRGGREGGDCVCVSAYVCMRAVPGRFFARSIFPFLRGVCATIL